MTAKRQDSKPIRAGGSPDINAPLTPPTAEFVIPTQTGIQASDFQKRLESVAQSNSRLHGGFASADGDTECPYLMDYIFRRPPQSEEPTTNTRAINTALATCRHLPAPVCFVIPVQVEVRTRTRRSHRPRQNSSFPRRRESRHLIFRNA